MAGRNFVSNELGARILQSVSYTENIGNPNQPTKRRIVRQRGGGGAGNTALCTILSKGANENQFNVSVKIGNPNAAATGSLPKGILYFNYATTNGIAIGGDILAVTFPSISGTEGVKFDCFAIETVMNLVAPPDEEEEEGEGEGEPPA